VPAFALLHSPLVGPSTWTAVADHLRQAGLTAVVPDLRAAAETRGTINAVVASAAEQVPRAEVVLVGHSGSGPLLPLVAQQVGDAITGLVFVDAQLPPTRQAVTLADAELREVRQRAAPIDGQLGRTGHRSGVPIRRSAGDSCDRAGEPAVRPLSRGDPACSRCQRSSLLVLLLTGAVCTGAGRGGRSPAGARIVLCAWCCAGATP